MLDEFRRQADDSRIEDLRTPDDLYEAEPDERFLGMTPFQRFLIALMVFVITFLVGTLWLLVNGKVVPPFF
jgi:hypothetical protein